MSIIEWFDKKRNNTSRKLDFPDDLWTQCPNCKTQLYIKELEENVKVCKNCQYHYRLSALERIQLICDNDSFEETAAHIKPVDFLKFSDTESYQKRIDKATKKTNKRDAILTGQARLNKHPINIACMDFSFMGGSMGSVVGEKLTRLIELAIENTNPLLMFTASGGARMQEGIMSLMQMAKTSAALEKLSEKKVPYISILCDPTTGGTSASFAMLGDLNIAEPGALISFAGPRVIEQTIRQKLPKGFQRSEFLLEKGMLDKVVHRKEMKDTLHTLISILQITKGN